MNSERHFRDGIVDGDDEDGNSHGGHGSKVILPGIS